MKFLATILCIYVLYVSAIPCCGDNVMIGHSNQTEQQSTDMAHSDCSGMCSPFCLCNTCDGFTIMYLTADIRTIPQNFSDANITYLSSTYLSPLLKGVWQPPQL